MRLVNIENDIVKRVTVGTSLEFCINHFGGEWIIDEDNTANVGLTYFRDLKTFRRTDEELNEQRNEELKTATEVMRLERNHLLNETDKYMVSDFPITEEKKQEFLTYRKSLRDLPANTPDPTNISWPTPPS